MTMPLMIPWPIRDSTGWGMLWVLTLGIVPLTVMMFWVCLNVVYMPVVLVLSLLGHLDLDTTPQLRRDDDPILLRFDEELGLFYYSRVVGPRAYIGPSGHTWRFGDGQEVTPESPVWAVL